MIGILDVHYSDRFAAGAMVLAADFDSSVPLGTVVDVSVCTAPYKSGEFYRRELPVLTRLLRAHVPGLSCVIVDCYVDLGTDGPGLGQRLYDLFDGKLMVIGVAKKLYRTADPVRVRRKNEGRPTKPLFVTSAGLAVDLAAYFVAHMHGPYRVPTIIKHADMLCRRILPA